MLSPYEQTYATANEPGVRVEPIEPRSPVGHVKKRKRWGLRIVLTTAILTSLFYGGSVYFSQFSERYRDFFVEEIPLAETLVQLVEDRQTDKDLVKRLSERAAQASGKQQELQKQRAERMAAFARQQEEKAKAKAAQVAEAAREKGQSAKEQVEQVVDKVEKGVEQNTAELKQKTDAVTEKLKEKAAEAKETVSDALHSTKDAITPTSPAAATVYPKETVPIDYQKPRGLDASPQPPKVGDKQPYVGPPLPLGFEPPPGYAIEKPKPAKVEDASAQKAKAPEPLPLVAPTVAALSSSEPVLGQLASTIDSLTKFLNDSPSVVENKGAREVVSVAGLDLQKLGERLQAIKEEERQKLSQRLEEKTREFNQNLVHAEREMVERLEKQEDDWKSAFEQERQELVKAYREKLDGEMSVQKDLIEQRLKEEVVAQGIEMQRRWLREIKEKVETERAGRLGKLEELQDGFEKLGKTTLENSSWLDDNRQVNKLWTAVRAAWQSSVDGKDNTAFVRELAALSNVAKRSPSASPDSENTIDVLLASIPDSVAAHGVETFPTLSGWFTDRLVPKIRKAALFPQNGGFLSYISSSTISNLLFQKVGFVQGDDVISTLSRAEWYLTHRDLESAAREVNQLNGWPKILARDWLEAARRHLEVRQALQLAEAEAGLASLLIV